MITKLIAGSETMIDNSITQCIEKQGREPDGIYFSMSATNGGKMLYATLLVWREGTPVK